MTKKRWIVLASLFAVGVCVTLTVLALLPLRPGVTQANIERIETGMTFEEVEAILGEPLPGESVTITGHKVKKMVWCNPRANTYAIVYFDAENRVVFNEPGPPTFFRKLRNFFRL
jgi:hypothetical protein